ncbi:MAG: helix-turn-helix domain-containing protein [Lautropia sp.]
MMLSLMNGQALTAGELARVARISSSTASAHLAKLSAEGLLKLEHQGRHRYYRLSSPDVARLLENMMQLATGLSSPARKLVPGPRDEATRRARTCYDHFAGRLGVNGSTGFLFTSCERAGRAALQEVGHWRLRLVATRRYSRYSAFGRPSRRHDSGAGRMPRDASVRSEANRRPRPRYGVAASPAIACDIASRAWPTTWIFQSSSST